MRERETTLVTIIKLILKQTTVAKTHKLVVDLITEEFLVFAHQYPVHHLGHKISKIVEIHVQSFFK